MATQCKLNAIADALADLVEQPADERRDLNDNLKELRNAVGLEQQEETGPPRQSAPHHRIMPRTHRSASAAGKPL